MKDLMDTQIIFVLNYQIQQKVNLVDMAVKYLIRFKNCEINHLKQFFIFIINFFYIAPFFRRVQKTQDMREWTLITFASY